MPRVGPFAVVRDHMGERRWSRNFYTLERAAQCFAKTTRAMGPPESADSVLSYWYEYGAHGERVAVVQRADDLKAAVRTMSPLLAIRLMGEYTVDLLGAHDGDAQEASELPRAAEQQVSGGKEEEADEEEQEDWVEHKVDDGAAAKCPCDQDEDEDEDALYTEEEQEDEVGRAGQGGGGGGGGGGGNKEEASGRDPSGW